MFFSKGFMFLMKEDWFDQSFLLIFLLSSTSLNSPMSKTFSIRFIFTERKVSLHTVVMNEFAKGRDGWYCLKNYNHDYIDKSHSSKLPYIKLSMLNDSRTSFSSFPINILTSTSRSLPKNLVPSPAYFVLLKPLIYPSN